MNIDITVWQKEILTQIENQTANNAALEPDVKLLLIQAGALLLAQKTEIKELKGRAAEAAKILQVISVMA